MTTWDRICRICSSPAEYDVFSKIPTYLHANLHESQHWQKPLNVLIEATTGLKVTRCDGLPPSICALCISYLKHAASFREQAVCNALSLTAVKMLRQQAQQSLSDKDSLLITTDSLNYATERQEDTNDLLNNYAADQQNKVNKPMLNNNFQPTSAPTQSDVEKQMHYLNLLFDKGSNTPQRRRYRSNVVAAYDAAEPNVEEETRTPTTTTSSDDNENAKEAKKQNIFSYREKNFEEDDIMDMEVLRNAIRVNIPDSTMERKCRACFRRFMFAASYKEHMDTCIEYQFITFIEEINRYLDIRRNKCISPHEFIRRMVFCLRRTCEWLKENCGDMLLPDLLENSSNGGSGSSRPEVPVVTQVPDSEDRSSTTSSVEQREEQKPKALVSLREQLQKQRQKQKMTDLLRDQKTEQQQSLLQAETKKLNDLNLEIELRNLFQLPKLSLPQVSLPKVSLPKVSLPEVSQPEVSLPKVSLPEVSLLEMLLPKVSIPKVSLPKVSLPNMSVQQPQLRSSGAATPILMTNNILYEIERSQSRNSSYPQSDYETAGVSHSEKPQVRPPIVGMATTSAAARVTTKINTSPKSVQNTLSEKLTLLQKMELACNTPAPAQQPQHIFPTSASEVHDQLLALASSVTESPKPRMGPTVLSFSARCNPCNRNFAALSMLEVHNAMYHNTAISSSDGSVQQQLNDMESERERIIALFEEED